MKQAAKEANYECPVCLTFCAEPVRTNCGHYFCMQCQKKLMMTGNNACPMCREFFDKNFMPKIDHELAQEAMNFNKGEFEERKAELIEDGEWFGENGALIKLCMGNNYEIVKKPTIKGVNGEVCNHRWAMYLTLNNDKKLTERYIKEVRYQLHPTYKISKVTVKEAPFMLSRVAYGSFNIEATIVFQDWTKAKPIVVDHMLKYREGGEMRTQLIEGKAEAKSKNMAPSKADLEMFAKLQASINTLKEQVDEY